MCFFAYLGSDRALRARNQTRAQKQTTATYPLALVDECIDFVP